MTERKLVRCLSDAEKGNETALRQWMDTTPDEEVTRRLRSIAKRASQSNNRFWFFPFAIAFYTYIFTESFSLHKPEKFVLSVGTVSVGVWLAMLSCLFFADFSKWRVRKGRSAVLVLAECGDKEMLPVLISYYLRYFKGGSSWPWKIENALINLLDKLLCDRVSGYEPPELYKLVATVVEKHALCKANRDLLEGKAYVTSAAMRLLAYNGGLKNRRLLISISQQRAPDGARFPNRRFVYDCAVQCLAKPVGPPVIVAGTANSSSAPGLAHPTVSSGAGGTISRFSQETAPLLLSSQQGSESA